MDTAIAGSVIADMDNATQDILHHIELRECTQYDLTCLGIELQQIRRTRRKAKDIRAVFLPVLEWAKENKKVVKDLEKLLGEVRKAEKGMNCRHYRAKTNVVEQILQDGEQEW